MLSFSEPRRTTEPRRPAEPRCPSACTASAATSATAATAAPPAPVATAATATMASPTILTFDAEGRAVDFDYVRSQWTTRDAVARLAVRSHLQSAERAHSGQYKTAQSLYDVVVARYSSPATTALSRLMLPYLFPDLAAFSIVADLITHLRTSDARYRAALPTEFFAKKPPPMYITLYYLVTHLPDSLASVGDHFLSLCTTELTIHLLEERLTAAEKSILAVVGGDAPAGARGARVEEGTVGAAVEAVEEAEGVAVEVGVVVGVEASVVAMGVVEGAAAALEAAAQRGGIGGGQHQQQPRSRETPSAQQLREWYAGRGRSGGVGPCTYVLCTGRHRGETQNVAIFDLDFNAILAAMYAVTDSAEGDCYLSVPPDPGIEAAALGASASAARGTGESAAPGAGESALSGIAPTEALHTFTLDSGASRFFFRDSTTLTPLSRPVAVSLADPSGGPVLAHSSTVLLCPAALSGLLSGLHLPSFSTNLVSGADLQDAWVDQFTPGGQRVTHCTCSRTGRHLATFTRRPGSSLYTLTTASPPVAASSQVAASGQVFSAASRSSPVSAPYSFRPLAHETLLWHHRFGLPSLPRLRGMVSRTLVSGLPRSLPPLPLGPAPTCVPCVKGRQRAAPHSSELPPTEAPLQTLHMDVWGLARVRGQGHERYFLLVVDDYSRYTTVFPLRSKDRGGEFSSNLLRAFCRAEGIRQKFTLPASPQQNGIAERRIGLVMDVARTSMIHVDAPHFLWPLVVQYAVHQINLQPRVSLPETTPTLRWMEKVGDASVFRVWGSRAFVRDTSADKLSSRAVPCVFLGFPCDAPRWQFYHPTSRRVLSSQDVTVLPPQVDPVEPVEVAVESGAARGAEPAGAGTGGVGPGVAVSEGAEPGGAEPERVELGGAESGSGERGGAEPERAESGGPPGVPSRREPLSPQQLREWYTLRCRHAAGAGAAGGAAWAAGGASGAGAAGGDAGVGVAGGTAGVGVASPGGTGAVGATGGAGAAGPGGARTGGTRAAGAGGASGVGAAGARAFATGGVAGARAVGGPGAGGATGVGAGDP
ncbi:unnamed protein product [Closterium sp. NIES-53]